MCIIVVQMGDNVLPKNIVENCWKNNDDGGGFAYVHKLSKNRVSVYKELLDFEHYYKNYTRAFAEKRKGTPIVLHFRIATQGGINVKNIHPHWIEKPRLALFHNGVIRLNAHGIYDEKLEQSMSDTALFAKFFLTKLPSAFYKDPALVFMVEQAIGSGNKLVTMDSDGYVEIFNKRQGDYDKELECWFSNSSYKYKRYPSCSKWGGHGVYEGWGCEDIQPRVFTSIPPSSTQVVGTTRDYRVIKHIPQGEASPFKIGDDECRLAEIMYVAHSDMACENCGENMTHYYYRMMTKVCKKCAIMIDKDIEEAYHFGKNFNISEGGVD